MASDRAGEPAKASVKDYAEVPIEAPEEVPVKAEVESLNKSVD